MPSARLTSATDSGSAYRLETPPPTRVTLEPIYCLGLCATAPSAMLDGRVVGRLDEARLDALVAEAQR